MGRVRYMETLALANANDILEALEGIQVYVYFQGTQVTAPIYGVRTGGSVIANPIVTDDTGRIAFFAENGEYDIRVVDSQVPSRIADQTYQVSLAEPMVDKSITSRKLALDVDTTFVGSGEPAINPTNTTFTTLLSVTVNAPYANTRYLVMASSSMFAMDSLAQIRWVVDGVEEPGHGSTMFGAQNATVDLHFSKHLFKTVSAGSHTFAIQWKHAYGTSIVLARGDRRIDAICLGAA